MDITIGQRLGSYEVTALLGKVGMGEVPNDMKLKREVSDQNPTGGVFA
jgi:hypothetical protein